MTRLTWLHCASVVTRASLRKGEMNTKVCSKCGVVQDISAFGEARDRPSGLLSWCNTCRGEYARQYRKDHPAAKRVPVPRYCISCGSVIYKGKRCGECRRENARLKQLARDTAKKQPVMRTCKECGKLFTPEYGNKRRAFCSEECMVKYGKRVCKAVRKARLRGVDESRIERIDPLFICERDGWCCYLCSVKTPKKLRGTHEPNAPEVDHVIPIARGGSHTEDNLRCCCRRCNVTKSDRMLGDMQLTVSIQLRLI